MAKKKRMPRKNDPEIYDDLVYYLMDTNGSIAIPMTGLDVQRICAGGYYTALCYGNDKDVSKLFEKYSDQKLHDIAKSYAVLDENELKDRQQCIACLLLISALEIGESDTPNIYLAPDVFQQKWAE